MDRARNKDFYEELAYLGNLDRPIRELYIVNSTKLFIII